MAHVKFRFGWGLVALDTSDGAGTSASFDTSVLVGAAPVAGVRRALLVFDRAISGAAEDSAVIHMDWLNMTAGAPDDSWVNADFAAIEGGIGAWWTSMRPRIHSSHTLREIRWYVVDGVAGAHPVVRTAAIGTAGSAATDPLPLQVALSVTHKTAVRKRWGRHYLPGFTETMNGADGRPDSSSIDLFLGYYATLYASGDAQGIKPVVYSPTIKAVYSIDDVTIDNTWDVIRSRRPGAPTLRHHVALTT